MNIKVRQIAPLFFMASFLFGGEPIPAQLLEGLASEEFAKREASQSELLEWARGREQAGVEILKMSRGSDDPEVQKRSSEVLRELSDEDYLSDGLGYLGITMQEEELQGEPNGKEQFGIRILGLMRGSPAEQAGIKQGDLIIALNGKTWNEIGAVTVFGDVISRTKPLVEVVLTVKRDEPDPVEIPVKLGKRPINDLREARESLQLLDEQARERHFRDWLKIQEQAVK
jgi:C-terminal processing protease CtpA/Prc